MRTAGDGHSMPIRITAIMTTKAVAIRTSGYFRQLSEKFSGRLVSECFFTGEITKKDAGRILKAVAGSDLTVADMVMLDSVVADMISEALRSSEGIKVVFGSKYEALNRPGRSDPSFAEDMERMAGYIRGSEKEDIESLFNFLLRKYFDMTDLQEPSPAATNGIYIKDPFTGRKYDSFSEYKKDKDTAGKQTVALIYSGTNYPVYTLHAVRSLMEKLSNVAYAVPIAFTHHKELDMGDLGCILQDSVPDVIINTMSFRLSAGPKGGSGEAGKKILDETDAAYLKPFFMTGTTESEWRSSLRGPGAGEFMIRIFLPELDGGTCTLPIGSVAAHDDVPAVYALEERIDRIVNKVRGYLRLRKKKQGEKRIAIIAYNYPPGEGNLFGGSYLDTSGSISSVLGALKDHGITVSDIRPDELVSEFIGSGLLNEGDWQSPTDNMMTYRGKNTHSEQVEQRWGKAPGNVMTLKGSYMIPGIINGNVFIGLQPARCGSDMNGSSKQYHDPYLPPHHQYLAFYEWLENEFKADIVIHIGTHGTAEFLPGKESGMTGDCFSDIVIGNMVHYYIYYLGNPSESMIAKRRTHAGMISHAPPPYERSELYGDLAEIDEMIAEYRESTITDAGRSEVISLKISEKAKSMRLPTEVDELEHEIESIRMSLIPNGLHIFGEPFSEEESLEFAIQSMRFKHDGVISLEEVLSNKDMSAKDARDTAESIYREYIINGSVPKGMDNLKSVCSMDHCKQLFNEARKNHEITNLLRVIDGGYLPVKTSGDFLRNPEMIPAGYNMVQFDPSVIPTKAAFERGAEAAENTISMYLEEHGTYPTSVAVVLWGIETTRSQGMTIGQIFTYLGIRMTSLSGSFASRFEIVPTEELGRPRIDVVINISGFFRDMFPQAMDGINDILAKLGSLKESDAESSFASGTRYNMEQLLSKGYAEEEAKDLALCRIFGPPEGVYGTRIPRIVNESKWSSEEELGDNYGEEMKYVYSKDLRGRGEKELLNNNFKRVDAVSQVRNNVEHELIDLDHFYEFFGGVSRAVENVKGSRPAMYISDNTGPQIRTDTAMTSIERGVRTRLLNPKWIDGLLRTEYHGVQKINERFENMVGLSSTTGQVPSSIFDDMQSRYISDPVLRESLQRSNVWAYMSMLSRLFEAYERGYWSATEEQLDDLRKAYGECETDAEERTDTK